MEANFDEENYDFDSNFVIFDAILAIFLQQVGSEGAIFVAFLAISIPSDATFSDREEKLTNFMRILEKFDAFHHFGIKLFSSTFF